MRETWESECGRVRLFLGNCLDFLIDFYADAYVTDPPYGIDHKSNGQIFLQARPVRGDLDIQLAVAAADIVHPKPLAMFFSPFKPLPIKWRSVLVWNKGPQVGIVGVRDNGALNGPRDSAVLDFPSPVVKPTGHFCEKPVPLMGYIIERMTSPGEVVCDPFMGTGACGVAAIRLGRSFIGCELDEQWFEIARDRIQAELDSQPLFASLQPSAEQQRLFGEVGG
jgi:hypothetical protein